MSVCVDGGCEIIWLRYATVELATVDHYMTVLELLGSSHHSWVSGCPWRWEPCKSLLASIIYDSVNLTSGRSTCAVQPIQWMSVECATKHNNSCWQTNTVALLCLYFQDWRNPSDGKHSTMWKLCFTISKKVKMPYVALCGLKWHKQARAKRIMWVLDSDLAGLRPLAGTGRRVSDGTDLPIHQSECDKAGAFSTEGQPWPGRRGLLYPLLPSVP